MTRRQALFCVFPILTISLFILPILCGLLGTWLPALGFFPAAGFTSLTTDFIRQFCVYPGVWTSVLLTLFVGFSSTFCALALCLWLTVHLYGTSCWRKIERGIAPLLAFPHASFAIGFIFLCAPTGPFFRFLALFVPELARPIDFVFISDPYGVSMSLALVIKETPFLLFMMIASLSQLPVNKILLVGKSLGYSSYRVWTRLLLPQIFPHLRLPLLAVLAYSLSVVDIGILVGPSLPPPLAVLVNSWFYSADTDQKLLGAVGASFLFFLVIAAIISVLVVEKTLAVIWGRRRSSGKRNAVGQWFSWTSRPLWIILGGSIVCSFALLLVQSFAHRWRYPDFFPSVYSIGFWERGVERALWPLFHTLSIGMLSAVLALILAIGCLEYEVFLKREGKVINFRKILYILYIPLLVPQVSFLFGVQLITVFLGLDGHFLSMVFVHLIFVLPYVFLVLAEQYRSYDERNTTVVICLGRSWWASFFFVKLPLLAKPLFFSVATGFAVSVVQYLPTLYIGAGRFATITTETVTLASGADKRIVAVYALLQFLLPAVVYILAVYIPSLLYRQQAPKKSRYA